MILNKTIFLYFYPSRKSSGTQISATSKFKQTFQNCLESCFSVFRKFLSDCSAISLDNYNKCIYNKKSISEAKYKWMFSLNINLIKEACDKLKGIYMDFLKATINQSLTISYRQPLSIEPKNFNILPAFHSFHYALLLTLLPNIRANNKVTVN